MATEKASAKTTVRSLIEVFTSHPRHMMTQDNIPEMEQPQRQSIPYNHISLCFLPTIKKTEYQK
jgi:hypothetical protein